MAKAKKKPRGRPPLPDGTGKDDLVRLRIPLAWKKTLVEAAGQLGVSEYIRRLLARELKIDPGSR